MVGYRSGPVDVMLTSTTINNADGSDSNRTTLLGGNYNFGVLRAYAAYTWNKGFGTLDTRDALVGVGVPLGAGNLMASYIKKTDKFKSNGDVNQVALGYYYDISKRTAFYTSISRTDNDSAASYNAAAAGAKSSLFNAGIRHRF
jgi:predicted porin